MNDYNQISPQKKYPIHIHHLGLQPYHPVYEAMRQFSSHREAQTPDTLWITEHYPTYTLGLKGDLSHVLDNTQEIPLYQTDRGGQVTYHGPGQIIFYTLLDLHRRKMGVKHLVHALEQMVIDFLMERGIIAERQPSAPGVYVHGKKIAALGLRVTRGCTYHGLSFNMDMDLTPFDYINPCGYSGLKIIQLLDFPQQKISHRSVSEGIATHFCRLLDYEAIYPDESNSTHPAL